MPVLMPIVHLHTHEFDIAHSFLENALQSVRMVPGVLNLEKWIDVYTPMDMQVNVYYPSFDRRRVLKLELSTVLLHLLSNAYVHMIV